MRVGVVSGWPHASQNRLSGGLAWPHEAHIGGPPSSPLVDVVDPVVHHDQFVADTDLRCWGLTSWDFRPLVESNAAIAWSLLQVLAERLRES